MKKLLLFFLLFFVHLFYAQENNVYHQVAIGETLSSVAKKYNATTEAILKLNPNAANGIKVKDVLIIPNPLRGSDNTQNIIVHLVQSKETKFGLSKKYGISIQELEAKNPQIIAGLQVGHELQIPVLTINFKKNSPVLAISKSDNSSFDHTVLPGETLYGIAKKNEITVDELTKSNSAVLDGILKSGQRLTIPNNKVDVSKNQSVTNSDNYKYHLVAAKETKYGLSKKYAVTINQLETLNPQIIKGLQTGQQIIISTLSNKNDFTPNKPSITRVVETKAEVKPKSIIDQEYFDHQILPKETLFGLSKRAGLSIKDFVELNPKLEESFQIGMIVKIPKNAVSFFNSETENAIKESNKNVMEQEKSSIISTKNDIKINSKNKDLLVTINKSLKKKVTIVLPFNDLKYKEFLAKSSNFDGLTNDFQKKNLEFYSGALKAIDSAKKLALNIDFQIIELQNDMNNNVNDDFYNNKLLSKSDAVIMPFYDLQANKTAELLNNKNTPVLTSQLSSNAIGFSNLYASIPSEVIIGNTILNYLKSKSANIIVINSLNRIKTKKYITENCPESKFVKISDKNVVDTDDLKKLLVKEKLNYVILDTDKSSSIISTTNVLLNELADFKIQIVVLDNALLNNYSTISFIRLNLLKMIYPSFVSIEKAEKKGMIIQKIFKRNPEDVSQNFIFGFDLTLDTLLRLLQDKKFETSAKEDCTEYIKFKFKYTKDNLGNNINQEFYILQQDSDGNIKVLFE